MWLQVLIPLSIWLRLVSGVGLCQHQEVTTDQDQLFCSTQQLDDLTKSVSVRDQTVDSLVVQCEDTSPVQSIRDASSLLQLFNRLESLAFDRCKFSELSSQVFSRVSSLRELRITTRNAEWSPAPLTLNSGCFEGLSALTHLELSGNGLRELNSEVFSDVSALKVLNLTNNRLRDFYSLSRITDHVSLSVIDVSDNSYTTVPSSAFAGHPSLRKLIMRRNHLLEIEELGLRNLPDLETVDLSENMLNSLPAMMLSESVKLRELFLQQNNISIVAPGLFSELPALTTLNVSHNQLSSQWVKRDTFSGLLRLVVLDLSFNQLSELSELMFRDLNELQVLRLDHNSIHSLPTTVFAHLRNLHILSLGANQLTVLDAGVFDSLQVLNTLILSNNNLKQIHDSAFISLFNVEKLRLDGNGLDSFPRALVNLTQLRNLDIADNNIGRIDGEHIGRMRHLSLFRAAGNLLSEISADLAPIFSSLSMLDLSRNRIDKIHNGAFGSHSRLRAIRLDDNHLDNVNGIFNNMSSLLWLNASDNTIEFFDYALFPSQLLWLDLHQNKIKVIGNFYSIQDKVRLETLDLSYNDIEQIEATSVPDSIKYFIISSNKLTQVKPGTLRNKSQLKRFDLSSNELGQLSLEAIMMNDSAGSQHEASVQYSGKAHLLIGGNPFLCDCTMDWLVKINSMTPTRKYPKLLDADQVMCRFKGGSSQPTHLSHATASDFLCEYNHHCFALCHCCNYVACDCEMRCPDPCTCHHDHIWSANIVDCRSRQLQEVSRSVPMDATRLLVDGNHIRQLESHTFIGRQRLQLLQVNNSLVEHIQNRSLSGLTSLRVLRLHDNLLTRLRGDEFDGLSALEELYLHKNMLNHVDQQTFTGLRSLKVLTLSENRLVSFEVWKLTANPYLVEISISGNPWSCECQFLVQMTSYVRENQAKIDDSRSLQCAYEEHPPNCGGILEQDEAYGGSKSGEEKGARHRKLANDTLPVVLVSSGMVSLVVLLTIGLIYRCRSRVCSKQRLLHPTKTSNGPSVTGSSTLGRTADKKPSHMHVTATSPVDDHLYDVFVTYSAQDTNFVNDMLTPMLENTEPTLRLCLLRRDAPPANYLGDAVRHCVQASTKTLLVISRNFLDSEWCRFDFKASHLEALRCNRNLVTILYGIERSSVEDELRTLLKGAALITYGERDFWRKLRTVLPPGRSRTLPPGPVHMTRVLFPSTSTSSAPADESPSPTCSTVVSEDRCPAALNHFRSLSHPQRVRTGVGVGTYGRTICSVSASMSEPSDHVYMTIDQYRTPPPPPPPSLPPGHPAAVYSTLDPETLAQYNFERTQCRSGRSYSRDYAPDRALCASGRTLPTDYNVDQVECRAPRPMPIKSEELHRGSPSQSLWV